MVKRAQSDGCRTEIVNIPKDTFISSDRKQTSVVASGDHSSSEEVGTKGRGLVIKRLTDIYPAFAVFVDTYGHLLVDPVSSPLHVG